MLPAALALESSPTRACGVLGFTVPSLNPRAVNTGKHPLCAWNRSHQSPKALKSGVKLHPMLQAPAAPTLQQTKHLPHFLQPTPASWDMRGSSHNSDIPGVATAPRAREAQHAPCTTTCLPHILPEACWEQTNSRTGRIWPCTSELTPLH